MTEKPSEQQEGRTRERLELEQSIKKLVQIYHDGDDYQINLVYGDGLNLIGWEPTAELAEFVQRWIVRFVADFALSERRKGMEEAAKLVCRGCAEGLQLHASGPYLYHSEPASGGTLSCYAVAIRRSMEVTR